MKKIAQILFIALTVASCASTSELKEAKTCKVWEDQPVVGPFHLDVTEKKAHWKGNCSLFGVFMCSWVEADMEGNQVFLASNGIFNSRGPVATFYNNKLSYDQRFTDAIAKVEPMTISKESGRVDAKVKALGKFEGTRTIQFNDACSEKQIAMGVVAVMTAKNKH